LFRAEWGKVDLELMREIVDALPFATVVVNSAGDVEWWNKRSEQIFGWKTSEVMGRPSPIVLRDRQDEFRAFHTLVLHGRTLRVKSLQQRKDGALIEMKTTMVPLRNGSGTIKHILILHEPASEPVFLVTRKAELTARHVHPSGDNRIDESSSVALGRFRPHVRELENCLEPARALSSGPLMQVADLPTTIQNAQLHSAVGSLPSNRIVPIAEMEKQAILGTIDQLQGDKVMAAKLLGIGKTTLYRKLKEYSSQD